MLVALLARQCGLEQAQQVVVLGDGAPWIWDLADEQFPGAVQIVDLYHAKEHVWDVAHAVFGWATQGEPWATHACSLLELERSNPVSAFQRSVHPTRQAKPECSRTCRGYFTTNAQRMRYPAFRAQGMHVGSGIAEAACKTVVVLLVSSELACAGLLMAWMLSCPCAPAVLNDTYDSFWEEEYAA